MTQIIPGSFIGTYETQSATLAMSKNDNNRGFKAGILILQVKDNGSKGATAKTLMFFEGDNISTEELKIFGKYKSQQPDAQGGYPVSLQALKESPEDYKFLQGWFSWPGGTCEDYKLRKGLCYGNDLNGNQSTKKDGTPIITDTINVFVQVKYFTPESDGSLRPHYFPGLGLEEQGRRMEDRFFKVPVEREQTGAAQFVQNNAAAEQQNAGSGAGNSAGNGAGSGTVTPF